MRAALLTTEGLAADRFFRNGAEIIDLPDRSWEGIRDYLAHPDGRMAKIRRDDYGMPWKPGKR